MRQLDWSQSLVAGAIIGVFISVCVLLYQKDRCRYCRPEAVRVVPIPVVYPRLWNDNRPIPEHLGVSTREFAAVLRSFQPESYRFVNDMLYAANPDCFQPCPPAVSRAVAVILARKGLQCSDSSDSH